jgi:carboxylesterase type B
VLLWIHGGGYTEGNAANAGGLNFVSSSNRTMVFVSIQYRLGAYGFLSSEAVVEDGSPNAALDDQRAAIDWVHRHIGAFGGDPSKVCAANRSLHSSRSITDSSQITIWGGSAGGGSVTAQLILHGGEDDPPFRAAIPGNLWCT